MNAARRSFVALLVLACFALAPPAHAAWPRSPYNSGTLVLLGQNLNAVRGAVSDGAGGAYVMLVDARSGNLDIYVQRITSQGDVYPGWTGGGIPVCTAIGDQDGTSIVPDGTGGVLLAWDDTRNAGNRDIYVQRITGAGLVSPGWPVNGVAVSTRPQFEYPPEIAPDGAGGVYLLWDLIFGADDTDIYGAHVSKAAVVVFSGSLYAPAGLQHSGKIVADNSGGFEVAFVDSGAGSQDVRVGRFDLFGNFIVSPTVVCAAAGDQKDLAILNDGNDGLWVAWDDGRTALQTSIYATHVGSNCVPTSGWATDGNPVSSTILPGAVRPAMIHDAADGALIAWEDSRNYPVNAVYAEHMSRSGFPLAPWPAGGAQIAFNDDGTQYGIHLVPDGTGGAVASWYQSPSASSSNEEDVFAQHVTANGTIAPHWPARGAAVDIAPSLQYPVGLVADSLGGGISVFSDMSGIVTNVSRAQRIDRFGALGNAEPDVVSVKDVPLDNGGSVKITWDASYLDADPGYDIGSYWIWRATPISVALQAMRGGAHWATDATRGPDAAHGPDATRGRLFSTEGALAGTAWEYVGSQPASAFARYSYIAPTLNDSTATFHPFTTFMVQARAAASGAYWGSAADSGLSVDNVAPSMPAPFSGTYSGGVASMTWGASPQSDVVGYALYRAVGPGFTPGPSNFVSQTASLTYPDPAATRYWYKVAAIDAHGNVSPYALAYPTGTTGVDDGPRLPLVLALHPVSPNPSREQATIAFDLPRDANVTLDVFDLAGRRVRSLVGGSLPAGVHRATWDGRDGDGHALGAGLYLITMDAEGRRLRQRFVLMR